MKTHWKKLTNPDYIGAYSINENEKERVVKIIKVSREFVTNWNGKKEECTIAHLENSKPMILNKTNCKAIAKAHNSSYIEDWVGKSIAIYATAVKVRGEVIEALRVRSLPPILTTVKNVLPSLVKGTPEYENVLNALKNGYSISDVKTKYTLTTETEQELCKNLK